MSEDIFAKRCQSDPQGVIKDLLGQITRQGQEIHKRGELIESVLTPIEAQRLLDLLKSQPVSVSRDFAAEELDEILTKKLKGIIKVAEQEKASAKKSKKSTKRTNDSSGCPELSNHADEQDVRPTEDHRAV